MYMLLLLLCLIYPCENASIKNSFINVAGMTQTTGTDRTDQASALAVRDVRSVQKTSRQLEKTIKRKCRENFNTECVNLLKELAETYNNDTASNSSSQVNETIGIRVLKELYNLWFSCLVYEPKTEIVHYNPSDQVCCNGLYNRTSDSQECCRGNLIDNTESFCCNDEIYNRREHPDEQCCGTFTYSTISDICCNGALFKKNDTTECCGFAAYDTSTHLCCFDMFIRNRTLGDACCGTRTYNASTHTCCEGNVQPSYDHKGSCCGRVSFDGSICRCTDTKTLLANNPRENIPTYCMYNHPVTSTAATSKTTPTTLSSIIIRTHRIPTENDGQHTDYAIIIAVSGGSIILVAGVGIVRILLGNSSMVKNCFTKLHWHKRMNGADARVTYSDNQYKTLSDDKGNADDSVTKLPLLCDDSASSYDMMGTPNIVDFVKDDYIPCPGNEVADLFIDMSTQTEAKSPSNKRTIFGKPYEHHFIVDSKWSTVEMPFSEAKMTLPQKVLQKNPVEVHCSSFSSPMSLRKKLRISKDSDLASPAVEYSLTGYQTLEDYACVTMPFIGAPSELQVWKFKSDEGLKTEADTIEVPPKGKTNEILDLFYVVEGMFVKIYTRSFSGFYCTTCRHRPINLRALVFGSYKRIMSKLEVRFMLYVVDEIFKFEDYKKVLHEREALEGRVLKKTQLLRNPVSTEGNPLNNDDYIDVVLGLYPGDRHTWSHRIHPVTNQPMFPANRKIRLSEIVQQCRECNNLHADPSFDSTPSNEWYLVNNEGTNPGYTFQCFFDINMCRRSGEKIANTPIPIDELQLRTEDRLPVQAGQDNERLEGCIRGMKEQIAVLPNEKRQQILHALAQKFSIEETSAEITFAQLRIRSTPDGIIETVVDTMAGCRFYEEIDSMHKAGFIPPRFMSKHAPTQENDETAEQVLNLHPTADVASGFNVCFYSTPMNQSEVAWERPLYTRTQNTPTPMTENSRQRPNNIGVEKFESNSFEEVNITNRLATEIEPIAITPRGELSSNFMPYQTGPVSDSHQAGKRPTTGIQEHASMDETHIKVDLSVIPEENEHESLLGGPRTVNEGPDSDEEENEQQE